MLNVDMVKNCSDVEEYENRNKKQETLISFLSKHYVLTRLEVVVKFSKII